MDGETLAAVLWANYIFVLILTANAKKISDIVLEYYSNEGLKTIVDEISLQEAYILNQDTKLIIGVRPSLDRSINSLSYSKNSI